MTQILSPDLQVIFEVELTHGNTVDRIDGSGHKALPFAIVLRSPLHRRMIELKILIKFPISWYSNQHFAGYICENTRQSVYGPVPDIFDLTNAARQKLSFGLHPIYELELALGNKVVGVDEPGGSTCPLAINFEKPLHKSQIESTLSLSQTIQWIKNHDAHYPIEGGYKCNETGQILMGPLM